MPPEVSTEMYCGNNIATGILKGPDALDLKKIHEGYFPTSVAVIENSSFRPLRMVQDDLVIEGTDRVVCHAEDRDGDKRKEALRMGDTATFEASVTIPSAPWNKGALLVSYLRPVESLIDIPPEHREYMLKTTGGLLRYMMDRWGTAYTGNNNGLAGLIGNKGFQSVGIPHWQVLPGFSDLAGTDDIQHARAMFPWNDNGMGALVGENVANELGDAFHLLHPASVDTDKMGITVDLPGFQPEQIASQEFDWFLRGLFLTMHKNLRQVFNDAYASDMNDVVKYIMSILRKDEAFDQEVYDQLFQQKSQDQAQTQLGYLYSDLMQKGTARKGPGWAWGLYCTPSGATLTTINGFHNDHMGPIQALGRDLHRSPIPPSPDVMEEIQRQYYEDIRNIKVAA